MTDVAKKPLVEALVTSAVVTTLVGVGALVVPKRHVATFVGLVFLAAVWRLVWTKDDARVREFGLQLGGLLLHGRISIPKLARETARAAAWALGLAALFFGPYYLAWRTWWHPHHAFSVDLHPLTMLNDAVGQLLLVALPEEAFYRGYLQTRFDEAFTTRVRFLGASLGPGIVLSSVVFAIGHFVTIPFPARLAVFFPSLVFGYLRARTRGIGASLGFHAFCNIFSELLGRAYGVY